MPDEDNEALQEQLDKLEELYRQGLVSEAIYQAALAGLGAESRAVFDQHRQHVDEQINVARDYVDQRQVVLEPGASPEALRRAYLHRVVQQTWRLPLAGVDPKAAREEICEVQLAAVYTALLTQRLEAALEPAAPIVRGESTPLRERERRRLSALEMLNREAQLVLLGEPGSGKSTFVSFVALCLAGEGLGAEEANLEALTTPLPAEGGEEEPQRQPWEHGALLPVRIVLRDLAARGLPDAGERVDGGTLWAFITAELGRTLAEYAPYLKKELLEQGGLILLDGLDEVPDARQRRAQVKQAVQGFACDFPRCRFLVTSRTYAYQRQDWKLEGFQEAVLSPFSPQQMAHFVDRWYDHICVVRNLNPQEARGQATLLKTAIERNERLAELAMRPLLLTLMASLHAWRGGSLPEKREELYADAVDLLLDQWESPKVVLDAAGQPLVRQPSLAEWLKVDRKVMRAELEQLAFEAHRDQPQLEGTADIGQGQLIDALMRVKRNPEVNPARLVEYIRDRAGLLAARGEGIYAFPHRTFQEYLAACHLTDHGFPEELAGLLRNDPQRWREAVLLAGAKAARGTASAAWNLAEELCHHEPPTEGRVCPEEDCWGALLAAQTLWENEALRLEQVAERNRPKLERIRRWMQEMVVRGWLPPVDRKLAGEALAILGDQRDFDQWVEVPAGPFWMGDAEDEDSKPRHRVTLPAFKIGKYPVTNAQYLRFLQQSGGEWGSDDGRRPERANCPAVYVSWHEARAYCNWLSEAWRAEGRIAEDELVRLPSEAEWEKAARGAEGYRWPWGDEWDEKRCNSAELDLGDTCAVGMFPAGASPYGCLDMAGQVWEWTLSLWGKDWGGPEFKYPYDARDGRENVEAGDEMLRVLRGGSFYLNRYLARCAVRNGYLPLSTNGDLGFRVVVSPISPDSGR